MRNTYKRKSINNNKDITNLKNNSVKMERFINGLFSQKKWVQYVYKLQKKLIM